jgi:hypothetical protein
LFHLGFLLFYQTHPTPICHHYCFVLLENPNNIVDCPSCL